jgi:tripartite-type tricarboxylate transporter receptor subunit TctC
MRRRTVTHILTALALSMTALHVPDASAQEYPLKPITIVVPHPPGSIADLIARALGNEISLALKQPVVVDNRPGASQVIASSYLARQKPDGYTLMISLAPNAIAPELLKTVSFKSNTNFEVVAYVANLLSVLGVSPKLQVNNLEEFIALLRANPGKFMYGSVGVGSPLHINLEMFNKAAQTKSVHVPYKVFSNITTDVMSGEIHYGFFPFSAVEFAASGKMKILGQVGLVRSSTHPDIKTLSEQGLAGYESTVKYFILAPLGTPAPIVNTLNTTINGILAREAYADKFKALGGIEIPKNVSPAQAGKLLLEEDRRLTQLIRELNIEFR